MYVPAGGGVDVTIVFLSTVIERADGEHRGVDVRGRVRQRDEADVAHEHVSHGTLIVAVAPLSASGSAGLPAAVQRKTGRAPRPNGSVTVTLSVAA